MITLEFIRNQLKLIMRLENYSEEQARWDLSISFPEYDELIWNCSIA